MQLVTFDFHNTVAHCDPWFDAEIRDLPALVIEDLAYDSGAPPDRDLQERATHHYRTIRRQVIDSGIERDALTCVVDVFEEIGLEAEPDRIAAIIDDRMRRCLPDLEPVPGSVATIEALIELGIPVGIVSSAVYHPFLEWALDEFGILDRLAFVATSASVGYYKSDVRIYHHAYRLVEASPELGVHVGDSPRWDIDTAQRAGLGTVLYTASGTQRPELHYEVDPDLVLPTMIDAHEPILRLLRERETAVAS